MEVGEDGISAVRRVRARVDLIVSALFQARI
jgi:hypothetical protein